MYVADLQLYSVTISIMCNFRYFSVQYNLQEHRNSWLYYVSYNIIEDLIVSCFVFTQHWDIEKKFIASFLFQPL